MAAGQAVGDATPIDGFGTHPPPGGAFSGGSQRHDAGHASLFLEGDLFFQTGRSPGVNRPAALKGNDAVKAREISSTREKHRAGWASGQGSLGVAAAGSIGLGNARSRRVSGWRIWATEPVAIRPSNGLAWALSDRKRTPKALTFCGVCPYPDCTAPWSDRVRVPQPTSVEALPVRRGCAEVLVGRALGRE